MSAPDSTKASTSAEVGAFLIVRHGQTEWSRSGQHTSVTDLPLLPEGENDARRLAGALGAFAPTRVLSSPRLRAMHTAELAGFGDCEIDDDLAEWNYGSYEGRTRADIQTERPGWSVWGGTPLGGESIEDVATRARRILTKVMPDILAGNTVAAFSHGHFSRVLVATWLELAPVEGRLFPLNPGSYGVLHFDRGQRVLKQWNPPV